MCNKCFNFPTLKKHFLVYFNFVFALLTLRGLLIHFFVFFDFDFNFLFVIDFAGAVNPRFCLLLFWLCLWIADFDFAGVVNPRPGAERLSGDNYSCAFHSSTDQLFLWRHWRKEERITFLPKKGVRQKGKSGLQNIFFKYFLTYILEHFQEYEKFKRESGKRQLSKVLTVGISGLAGP